MTRWRPRRGLGLVETMISLIIVAGLLIAMASAFCAASNALEYNDDYYRAAQAVRVAMARMTTEIRQANSCLLTGSNVLTVNTTDPLTAASVTDVYTYSSSAQAITVGHTVNSTTTTYVLPVKFSTVTFASQSNANGTTFSIVLKATAGGMPLSLSGSASPRKLLAY